MLKERIRKRRGTTNISAAQYLANLLLLNFYRHAVLSAVVRNLYVFRGFVDI